MKRTIALGAAWTASAAAAVGLGFLAVSLVDASASPGAQPVAATTAFHTGSPSTTMQAPAAGSATAEFPTAAGTVYADCTSGTPVLAGVPVAGWSVDDSNDPGRIEFRAGTQRVEVSVSCVGGAPAFRLDDSSSSASSSTPGGDDSSGRVGGGQGADDGPGDDSSGRDGGGHGADG